MSKTLTVRMDDETEAALTTLTAKSRRSQNAEVCFLILEKAEAEAVHTNADGKCSGCGKAWPCPSVWAALRAGPGPA